MRIVLFDGIMEMHVVFSLARALRQRGHVVSVTGKLAGGYTFIEDEADRSRVTTAIERVRDFGPDAVLVFRPASLPFDLLRQLREATQVTAGRLVAWLSDDPVLWKLSYGPVLDFYDVILHCGGRKLLEFYEEKHGRPTGVNFPFWTDSVAFPYVYGRYPAETDAVFLGNVSDRIRRQRYFELGQLNLSLRIHGKIGDDYHRLFGGYLDTTEEIVDAGSRARVAINIPQYFTDHLGQNTWFDGLGDLGHFQVPSRVVQYAAMGLPVVSLEPGCDAGGIPEVLKAADRNQLEERVRQIIESESAVDLSLAIRERFLRDYSAGARALALENILESEEWRRLDAGERAEWFASFDGTQVDAAVVAEARSGSLAPRVSIRGIGRTAEELQRLHLESEVRAARGCTVAVIGDGWGDHVSTARIVTRALGRLGHDVLEVSPRIQPELFRPDPFSEFAGLVDVDSITAQNGSPVDVVICTGDRFLPVRKGGPTVGSARLPVIVHGINSGGYDNRLGRLISAADAATMTSEPAADEWRARGFSSVRHVPDLMDRDFCKLFLMQSNRPQRVAVLAQRAPHITVWGGIASWVPGEVDRFIIDEERTQSHGLGRVARAVNGLIVFALSDPSRPGRMPNRLLGHALFGGGLVVLPRNDSVPSALRSGVNCLVAGSPDEAHRKITRLSRTPEALEAVRAAGVRHACTEFAAEERIQLLLEEFVN